MRISVSLPHVRTSFDRGASYFHSSWPGAMIGLGVVATIVWNAFLAYMAVRLIRKVM
jgi:hypothetical protein